MDWMDCSGPIWTENWFGMDLMDGSGPSRPKLTEWLEVDRNRPKWTEINWMDQSGSNGHKWTKLEWMDQNKSKCYTDVTQQKWKK